MEAVMSIAVKDGNLPIPDDPEVMQSMLNDLFQFGNKDKDGGISTDEFRTLLKLQKKLGGKGASEKTAKLIFNTIKN